MCIGGARTKDRYRGALLDVRVVSFDHPEQSIWRKSLGAMEFSTVAYGDTDTTELTLSFESIRSSL